MKQEIIETLSQSPLPRTSGGKYYAQAFANVERLRASAAAKVNLLENIVATKGKTPVAAPVAGKTITAAAFATSNAAPQMSAAEFRKLSQTDRAKYLSAGGSLYDETVQPVAKTPLAERKRNSVWITDFNKLSPAQKAKHIAAGGNVHD